eukprot:5549080-Pleurochrysis_carterae.AAC.1
MADRAYPLSASLLALAGITSGWMVARARKMEGAPKAAPTAAAASSAASSSKRPAKRATTFQGEE